MNKVLFFARDPGAANVVYPIIKKFMEEYSVVVYGKDYALSRFCKEGIKCINIMDVLSDCTENSVWKFIKAVSPDIVVTGSSLDDFTERFIWKACERQKIPSYAIMDQWINLGIRFSEYDYKAIEEYKSSFKQIYFPKKILVMDNHAKSMLIEENMPEEKIVVTGSPYFDVIKEKYKKARKWNGSEKVRIVYASEPISVDYEPGVWGFDEKSIFEAYCNVINSFAKKENLKFNMIIRPHPREPKNKWENGESEYIEFTVDDYSDNFELLKNADIVAGMSSMFLIEAVMCNKPIMSCLIGIRQPSPFVFEQIGCMKSCRTLEALYTRLEEILIKNDDVIMQYKAIPDSIEKVAKYIKEDAANVCFGN